MDQVKQLLSATDLQLAAAVQEALLKCEIPQCQCGKILVKNRMCVDVGGDFYHFRQLNQDQIAFAIGDAMGHGASAALIMSLIMGLLRAESKLWDRPSRIVENINKMLVDLGGLLGSPITCSLLYGMVDIPSGILIYVNAGHPHPVICNRVSCKSNQLGPTTMLLGVQAGVRPESCHQFEKNDRLVLFTDGLTDAKNSEMELFGIKRLCISIGAASGQPPGVLAENLFDEIDNFCGNNPADDDRTLAIIDFDNVLKGQ